MRGRTRSVPRPQDVRNADGGTTRTPVSQIMETHENKTSEDANEGDVKTCKAEEAQENLTGDLPSPSREVVSVDEETDEDDTDEIFFTAPEEPIGEDQGGEGTVHTEEQSETREYLPGDISRSPQREVLNDMSTHQPRDNADHIAKGMPTAGAWRRAARMIGRVIAGSMFVAAAQYGGVKLEVNVCRTPHVDQRSPSREVPAPKGMMDDVAITDTVLPENLVEVPKIFIKYGAKEMETEVEAETEEETEEDVGESCGWGAVPEWIKYDLRIHGKVVRLRKRSTREDSKGDDAESPARGVPEPAPIMPGTFTDMEVAELEGLSQASPTEVAAFLVQIGRETRASKGELKRHQEQVPDEDVGIKQPEVLMGGDPSVFTQLTEPHKPERVVAVLEAVTIGPDLTQEQRGRVQAFVSEFADCFALSMKEVITIPGAEHTMNIPADTMFSTKVHQ
ncbi:hypothetical protein DFH08DRAFT_978377 [Mycena albidolilacea]|uniref:Uncharacterized protein n=1 Tax=Mycena albidolilacea TaxID=1033008 RepID=A0AAD7E865_9AGAR|nr:hypothetical protein DFH08DRAFT_978377 [Mycena albidolilacea]